MIAAVLKDTQAGERRVAIIPAALPALTKLGIEVVVESGAGLAAGFPDAAFVEKGARIASSRAEAIAGAEVLLQVRPLRGEAALEGLTPRHVMVGFLDPLASPQGAQVLAACGATAFALELAHTKQCCLNITHSIINCFQSIGQGKATIIVKMPFKIFVQVALPQRPKPTSNARWRRYTNRIGRTKAINERGNLVIYFKQVRLAGAERIFTTKSQDQFRMAVP
jgi:hypothetical protein